LKNLTAGSLLLMVVHPAILLQSWKRTSEIKQTKAGRTRAHAPREPQIQPVQNVLSRLSTRPLLLLLTGVPQSNTIKEHGGKDLKPMLQAGAHPVSTVPCFPSGLRTPFLKGPTGQHDYWGDWLLQSLTVQQVDF
jgi:hypothetical protein